MKIGYPCINTGIGCTANSTFRINNYSEENLVNKIEQNLDCLIKILEFNFKNNILFFRIGSGLIPFGSHEICKTDWKNIFNEKLKLIGDYIKKNNIRISMHPDQFVVLNAQDKKIVHKSIEEIKYHCLLLDAMSLKSEAKVQIHVGGVYNAKEQSIKRFIENYLKLDPGIKKRLVLENDHNLYNLKDCLYINKKTGIPIVFDVYHHECFNNGEKNKDSIKKALLTWKKRDGCLIVDYSNHEKGKRRGVHAKTINLDSFKKFLKEIGKNNLDIMLELKDKERSALKALKVLT